MTRINVHLTDRQREELRAVSDETGLTVAEVIRRAVDTYIEQWQLRRQRTKEDQR